MRHLTRTRTITSIIIIVLAILIGFIVSLTFATRYYVSAQRNQMMDLYESICDIYGDPVNESLYSESNRKEMDLVCEQTQVSLCIMDSAGNVIFSYGDANVLSSRLEEILFGNDESISSVYEDGDYVIQNSEGENGAKYVEMWGFLDNGCSFIARTPYSSIENSITITMRFFAIISLSVVVAIVIILVFMSRSYTKSLKKLIRVAQESNEGNFEYNEVKTKSRGKRSDELDILGDNISQLASKLEKTISELKTSNLKLENELKAKTELEEARKKYMSDVSHELKTPLALISSYAEGLKEGIGQTQEDRDYYLDVIIDEADKMNVIIKKLATLNQLEEGESAVSLERFNVVEAIDGFLNTMSIVIEEKGVDVYFDNKASIYVWTDEFYFEEVFVNYFNNALNHVDDKKTISINVEYVENNNVRVTVFNTGENIPPEEMDKIWEKFYKVDKARTRAYGGSGLGLSIVKAVANSLGKECGVYNKEDGVAFWIDLEAASTPETVMDAEKIERSKLINIPHWFKNRNSSKDDEDQEDIDLDENGIGYKEVPEEEQNSPEGSEEDKNTEFEEVSEDLKAASDEEETEESLSPEEDPEPLKAETESPEDEEDSDGYYKEEAETETSGEDPENNG